MSGTLGWSNGEARIALDAYEGLVRLSARRLLPAARPGHALDEDDLLAEGRVAVLEALGTYGGYGITERTWVRTRIRQRMVDAIRRLDLRSREEIRLVVRHAAGETTEDHDYERGRTITARRLVSIDSAPHDDGEPMVWRLADTHAESVEDAAHQRRQHGRLVEALDTLPPRQRLALELGLFDGLALRDIGDQMGISESRVCQLQKCAVRQLNRAIAA